jgi:hypothetical protein
MLKKALVVFCVAAMIATMSWLAGPVLAGLPCPWSVSMVGVAKETNGKHKTDTWFKGFFPVSKPRVAERPEWYINGDPAGKAQTYFSTQKIPNSSNRFKPGSNTVLIKFNKAPYNGATFKCTIKGFDWDLVPPGGHKWYLCK